MDTVVHVLEVAMVAPVEAKSPGMHLGVLGVSPLEGSPAESHVQSIVFVTQMTLKM